ncbi:MAG: polysaccharide deacetylase [Chloroflexota bacterium]|nr:polysaccharide deacetylase [Chloroflexota bacterium]
MAGFRWPEGKRCVCVLSFDVDGETIPFVRDPENARRRLTLQSEAAYGPNVGAPRLLDLLAEYGLPASFYIPGFTAERHPDLIERILRDGHELGHHGYLHERPDTLDDEQEEAVLLRGIEVLERLSGMRPRGYRSPSWELKPGTPALLRRHGFVYDSSLMGDDVPYLVDTPGGPLVELPVQWINDDAPHYSLLRGISSQEKVLEIWQAEFAGYHRYGGCYVLTMHPFISGRPSRVLALERFIRYVNGFPGVWWATCGQIADYCLREGVAQARPLPDMGSDADRVV